MKYKIIIIVTYILSFYYNYQWFSKAFSTHPYLGPKISGLNPDRTTFLTKKHFI